MIKDDTVDIDTQEPPNLVWNYPLFKHKDDPDTEFAVVSVFWVMTWEQFFSHEEVSPERKALVEAVADRAKILEQFGIVHTGNFFTLRDIELTPLIGATIRFSGMSPLDIYIIKGDLFDKKQLEFNMVTIN